jgi:transposase-like protein
MAISFKGAHFPQDIILMGVRWYVAYPLSYRHVEELMEERGVPVDHATIQRWVVKYSPLLEIYQSCNLHKTLCQPKNRLQDCHPVSQEP